MPKTALLIIDMQNFFRSMTTTSLSKVQHLHQHFSQHHLPIVFTQHGHPKEELKPPFKNQLVRKWGVDGSIHRGSDDWEFMPGIKELADGDKDAIVVQKNTYDAFINTNLAEILEGKKVERVVVCGVMTDCCCDTTARSCFNRGWETWLASDACGSANKRQHDAGLRGFGFAFGDVLTTEETIERLSKEGK